jgi:uncharacterized protein YyaL (SSP411 family)
MTEQTNDSNEPEGLSGDTNALANETSPYLLQHAHNPVQWYPWGEEALSLARTSNKPVLLSIGYSACHWCHVMAHESFENEETARLMNRFFVNIKVDREERPDIDKIYQLAHQLLTRRPGGWPLTAFLLPSDLTPFFAGTYFPPTPRHGMPSFKELMLRIVDVLGENTAEIAQQNQALREALTQAEPRTTATDSPLDTGILDRSNHTLLEIYDATHGGFGQAPKFPHPTNIERLLRDAARTDGDMESSPGLEAAIDTLRKMADGGIYDHLGGGFARYSVDELWMIPHFEKMLYDNGPLLELYADAWRITNEERFEETVLETGRWVIREMQSTEGGYYSSLDADSEGEEGKFYVWDRAELQALLDEDEFSALGALFGFDREPNFEGKHWHLHRYVTSAQAAAATGIDAKAMKARLASGRAKLLAERETRIRPARDDKVLGSWNGLMIAGMARAGQVFDIPEFIDSSERALDFCKRTLWRDGKLLATYKDGKAHLNAYLDDYALLIHAALTLLSVRWRTADLTFAQAMADVLLAQFEDETHGGFYFTAHDHEALLVRNKPTVDDALPAGNGVAATVLGRLGHLLADPRYLAASERALKSAQGSMQRIPHAHNAMLTALEEYLEPPELIVIRGTPAEAGAWQRHAERGFRPNRLVFAPSLEEEALPGVLSARAPVGDCVAYVCRGHQCDAPITDFETFRQTVD